ncbi:hypothetical protein F8M41_009204 [Gigaspora margarita]|uniref:Apple domain-containing protein n=1 Tax=Gigaspora margarita TaxID=4874 RepID=A0A8H4EQK0_GIGMA|nr:hypothetical protein F8M41_009204 [Gigaspora margarita]
MNKLLIIFLIYLLVSIIDASKYPKSHKYNSLKTCTITDVSTVTATSTITCSTETPTLIPCPDHKVVPNNCHGCEKTTITTCTPTTTICAPTSISEEDCCGDGGPGRNDIQLNAEDYIDTVSANTLADCCRACYENLQCAMYSYGNGNCALYAIYSEAPTCQTSEFIDGGVIGCGICRQ